MFVFEIVTFPIIIAWIILIIIYWIKFKNQINIKNNKNKLIKNLSSLIRLNVNKELNIIIDLTK